MLVNYILLGAISFLSVFLHQRKSTLAHIFFNKFIKKERQIKNIILFTCNTKTINSPVNILSNFESVFAFLIVAKICSRI